LARAAAHFNLTMPWMISTGMRVPDTLKFSSERAVWMPYQASSGTSRSPRQSFSFRMVRSWITNPILSFRVNNGN
jgi:hypothetical protein